MNTHKMLTPKGDTVVVYSTVTRYTWFTGWVRNHGIATADLMVNVRNIVGACQVKPCYQTAAALIDYPDAPTVITAGSYLTAAGFGHFRETLGLTSKYWIRFGVASSNTSGVALGTADVVDLKVAYVDRSAEVGRGRVVINPGQISGTDTNYFELGEWTPTVGIDKVMAAIVFLDNESTYSEHQLVCRSAIDPRSPNAWQTMEAAWSNPAAGNSVRNTTALSVPAGANATTNFLLQFGLAVRKKSGAAGNPRCELVAEISRSAS